MMTSLTLSITSPQKELMGTQATKTFDTNGGTIGRASRNDWVLPEETVSSQHALISYQDNGFSITDLSTNGVFINESDTPLGTGCTTSLSGAHTISIGLYSISVTLEPSQDAQNIISPLAESTHKEPPTFDEPSPLNDSTTDPLDLLDSAPSGDTPLTNNILPENLFDEPQTTSTQNHDQQAFENAPSTSVADAFIPPSTHTEQSESSPAIPDNWDETCFSPAVSKTSQDLSEKPLPTPAEDSSLLLTDQDDLASQQTLITPAAPPAKPAQQPEDLKENQQAQWHNTDKPEEPISQTVERPEEVSAETESNHKYTANELLLAKASFLKNGLDVSLLDDPGLVDQTLAILPFVLEGILATLRSRSEIKNELRASQTILQQVENNPLKFSTNMQDAIQNLLINQRPGFLSPEESIKQAFQDITQHEAALIMGIQTGLNAMLKKVSPEAIETKIENLETKKNLFGKISAAKKWEYYKETFQHITENSSNSFIDMFGDDFVKGYETYISNNKHYGR